MWAERFRLVWTLRTRRGIYEWARLPSAEDLGAAAAVLRRRAVEVQGCSVAASVFSPASASALTLGFAALAAGSAPPSFARAKTQATGTRPDSVTIGDVNRDGNADLAVTNTGTEEERDERLRASETGQRNLSTKGRLRNREPPGHVRDRRPERRSWADLVTANIKAGTDSVLLNEGGGTFQAKVDYATGGHPLGRDRRPGRRRQARPRRRERGYQPRLHPPEQRRRPLSP